MKTCYFLLLKMSDLAGLFPALFFTHCPVFVNFRSRNGIRRRELPFIFGGVFQNEDVLRSFQYSSVSRLYFLTFTHWLLMVWCCCCCHLMEETDSSLITAPSSDWKRNLVNNSKLTLLVFLFQTGTASPGPQCVRSPSTTSWKVSRVHSKNRRVRNLVGCPWKTWRPLRLIRLG